MWSSDASRASCRQTGYARGHDLGCWHHFEMGDDERPAHDLKVAGFSLDRHEVTNAQFAMLIDAM
jgi:formylglycine-generating enzyme required for sulfatase activity